MPTREQLETVRDAAIACCNMVANFFVDVRGNRKGDEITLKMHAGGALFESARRLNESGMLIDHLPMKAQFAWETLGAFKAAYDVVKDSLLAASNMPVTGYQCIGGGFCAATAHEAGSQLLAFTADKVLFLSDGFWTSRVDVPPSVIKGREADLCKEYVASQAELPHEMNAFMAEMERIKGMIKREFAVAAKDAIGDVAGAFIPNLSQSEVDIVRLLLKSGGPMTTSQILNELDPGTSEGSTKTCLAAMVRHRLLSNTHGVGYEIGPVLKAVSPMKYLDGEI